VATRSVVRTRRPADPGIRLAHYPLRMALLGTRVERDTGDFERRRERMEALVDEVRQRTAQIARGGGERALERHRSRGKLTARERVDRLLDPRTAFLSS
jgi:3-methylcrotonyl-CoA carboxylase beta subunit